MKHMLTRRSVLGASAAAAITLGLAACGGSGGANNEKAEDGKFHLKFSTWSDAPEFSALAEAFTAANPDIVVDLVDYNAKEYDTQLTADLAGGTGPDIITIKNLYKIFDYVEGGMVADLTDIANEYKGDDNLSLSPLEIDGKYYNLPFRSDAYVVYYNKTLIEKVGETVPDGNWTWEDFNNYAINLSKKFEEAGLDAKGAFIQPWPGLVQGFAISQTPGAFESGADQSGDLAYLKPFYKNALALQDNGGTETFSTAQAGELHYKALFNSQKAALVPIGTWFMGMAAKAQQEAAEADKFEWGILPAPQVDSSTFSKPVTFGSPTTAGVNAALEGEKLEAAKKFVKFMCSEEAAKAVAAVGVSPAYVNDAVVDELFAGKGMPQDELSKKAYSNRVTTLETTLTKETGKAVQILTEAHSAIMTESTPLDEAIATADEAEKNQGVVK
ncbi:ABC transporter substrate-binding protein [Actinomyces vulturis]|uniref:ABC transporter substrate-binding protein n=1 Tax=Actinomyces vulturis TaxID=1857645 RepID=UPI000830B1C5|nr:extracellular solute-binding protein [Actinomyces vulturis]